MRQAAVDNDFVEKLAVIEWNEPEGTVGLVKELFSELDVNPIMHELVYHKELMYDSTPELVKRKSKEFFDDGIICVMNYREFLPDEAACIYYKKIFEEIYNDFSGKVPVDDIFTEWVRKASFGETHSLVMCVILECDIFLSDDLDSIKMKRIIEEKFYFNVNVLDRKMACDRANEIGKHGLSKKKRRVISHR